MNILCLFAFLFQLFHLSEEDLLLSFPQTVPLDHLCRLESAVETDLWSAIALSVVAVSVAVESTDCTHTADMLVGYYSSCSDKDLVA